VYQKLFTEHCGKKKRKKEKKRKSIETHEASLENFVLWKIFLGTK
jgi:hypothetical protein